MNVEDVYIVVAEGARACVAFAVRPDGSVPAQEHIESLEKSDQNKLIYLFKRFAVSGEFTDRTRFKKLDGDLYEFKSGQQRISCYRHGNLWFLLHGFTKKQDNWPKGQLEQAKNLLWEHSSRLPRR